MKINKKSLFLILLILIPVLISIPTIAMINDGLEENTFDLTIDTSALPTNIVINEILFDDTLSGDAGEFIELYNPTQASIDISNWNITDEESTGNEAIYRFPGNCSIPSRGFIIIFKDINPGNIIQPDDVANDSLVQLFECIIGPSDNDDTRVTNLTRVGGMGFEINLANAGDELFLINDAGSVVDSVSYGDPPDTSAIHELYLDDSGGEWDGFSFERVWTETDGSWDVNGTGWAVKHTPTPGKLNGTVPEYTDEDPFGGGIPDTVLINEVYFDTIYETGTPSQTNQFIEIFNPTDRNFNVTGWSIETKDGQWEFIKSKWADELGDSDILLIWPDNDQTEIDDFGNWPWDPADDIGSWWEFWNNVDDMETWYADDDFNHSNHGEYKNHELHNITNVNSDLNLSSTGDFVVLRDEDGNVIDAVAWGTGFSMPGDVSAYAYVGLDHGIGTNESLERIWQKHLPVCDFLSGPGVYHLPTPGKKVGTVPDEIEEGTEDSFDVDAGTFNKGSESLGIEVSGSLDNGTRIDVAKYTDNPKDHEPSGLINNSEEVAFWHIQANNTVDPMTICIYIPDSMDINLSTLQLYEWDFEEEDWKELSTTSTPTVNNKTKVCATTELNNSISDQKWIGVFATSTIPLGEIPGFEWIYVFTVISLISLAYIWLSKRKISK
ncbi:MAG: hypothetical protein GF329_03945 [Candidatus Lokiarchaeota archaeon]|nr:hypothetical protein [Candidatus Lokiarchaeota archaeon]